MGKRYDVIVIGDYCLDLIFAGLPHFPRLGVEVVAKHFAMIPGATFNTVAALHRLGISVGWAGDFGNDDFSRFALEQAQAEGLDESLFVRHDRPLRKITIAASYPEDRAFIAYYDPDPPIPAGMKALAKASAKVLHLPGLYYGSLLEAGLQLIKLKKMKLIMDGNSDETDTLEKPEIRRALCSADIFIPNAHEARRLTGEPDLEKALQVLGELTPLVVIKNGAGGAIACQGDEVATSPALELTPLDTTGAGDAFNAGFIAAWLREKPLETCLRWGNIVGGLSTQGLGGAGVVVRPEDVAKYL